MPTLKPRFVILSGPSCAGKGPLVQAVRKFYPAIRFKEVGVIKSRESRPGGVLRPTDIPADFRQADEIKSWQGQPQYIVGDCRGLPQAVDVDQVEAAATKLAPGEVLYLEAYYTLGRQVRENQRLAGNSDLATTSIFLSPLSQQEIDDLKTAGIDVNLFLTNLMMSRLLARARVMGQGITEAVIADARKRAADAPNEVAAAKDFSVILVNHDGEGHHNWHYDYQSNDFTARPEGDAGRVLTVFSEGLVQGHV